MKLFFNKNSMVAVACVLFFSVQVGAVEVEEAIEQENVTENPVETRGIFKDERSLITIKILDRIALKQPLYLALMKKVESVSKKVKSDINLYKTQETKDDEKDFVETQRNIMADLVSKLISMAGGQHSMLTPIILESVGEESKLAPFFALTQEQILPTFHKEITTVEGLEKVTDELCKVTCDLSQQDVFLEGYPVFIEWMKQRQAQ